MNNSKKHCFAAALIFSQVSSVLADSNDTFRFYEEEAKVVTASKSEEKLSDAPGIISVYTKDDLERFGGTTLSDILQKIPGLTRSANYMTDRSMIAIRGSQFKANGGHVLLLLNGRPVREVLEGGIVSEMYESFPVNIIERIEVIKGPGSVLYGTGAVAGVINIITEKPKDHRLTVAGLGGEKGAHEEMAKASVKEGDLGVAVAGMYHKKPDWNLPYAWTDDIFKIPGTEASGTQQVHIPNEGPGAFAQVNYKNLSVMSSYAGWDSASIIPDYAADTPAFGGPAVQGGSIGPLVKSKKSFVDAGYHQEYNPKWKSDLNVTYSESDMYVHGWPNVERHSYEALGEWAHFINPIEKLDIVAGGSFGHVHGVEYNTNTDPKTRIVFGDKNNVSLYTQVGYWLHKDVKVFGGIQANKVPRMDWDANPRAGFIVNPVESINIKLQYAQAYKAPSMHEIGINFAGLMGNPSLNSEKIHNYDAAVTYTKGRASVGADAFYVEMKNIIIQDRSQTPPQYMNDVGKSISKGAELESKVYATREFLLTASVLYQTSLGNDGAKNVVPIANWGGKGGVSYKSDSGVTVSLFDIYEGSMDNRFNTALNPTPGNYNRLDFNSRFEMTKLAGWKWTPGLALLLRVDNALDRQLWLPAWGLAAGTSMPVEQGRTIYFGAEVSF